MMNEKRSHLSDELGPRLQESRTGPVSTTAEGSSAPPRGSESLFVRGLVLADYTILNELGAGVWAWSIKRTTAAGIASWR